MVRPFYNRIRLNTAVQSIQRKADNVILYLQNGQMESFDAVVLALHSDQALKLLQDPSIQEEQILGSMGYHANQVVLHTDTHLLPRRRRAWAAWNYNLHRDRNDEAVLTYNMNMLQNLEAPQTFCVSLNANDIINPKKILRTMTYYHPQYTLNSVAAQKRHAEINGVRRTFYCGAYWGYGFHEDGVKSGLLVARAFGV
jgi:predicted NAD/FAD-binding protein